MRADIAEDVEIVRHLEGEAPAVGYAGLPDSGQALHFFPVQGRGVGVGKKNENGRAGTRR